MTLAHMTWLMTAASPRRAIYPVWHSAVSGDVARRVILDLILSLNPTSVDRL